jgi:hypothetical protein
MALYYFQLPQELSQFCLIYALESYGTQSITDVHLQRLDAKKCSRFV